MAVEKKRPLWRGFQHGDLVDRIRCLDKKTWPLQRGDHCVEEAINREQTML